MIQSAGQNILRKKILGNLKDSRGLDSNIYNLGDSKNYIESNSQNIIESNKQDSKDSNNLVKVIESASQDSNKITESNLRNSLDSNNKAKMIESNSQDSINSNNQDSIDSKNIIESNYQDSNKMIESNSQNLQDYKNLDSQKSIESSSQYLQDSNNIIESNSQNNIDSNISQNLNSKKDSNIESNSQNSKNAPNELPYFIKAPIFHLISARIFTFSILYVLLFLIYFGVFFKVYGINTTANSFEFWCFALMFIMGTASFGVMLGTFMYSKSLPTQIILLSSMPLVFMMGFIYPIMLLPQVLQTLIQIVPAYHGINGFLRLNQMSDTLNAIMPHFYALFAIFWICFGISYYRYKKTRNAMQLA
ncbi:ABC transporter permease [Helicobacter saguini]|uniref:ABC transporter permease n=2 Tax=Helicobacter saguini TaxID=1548018 RepID=A0A347W0C6_9HELI|nr:ABC transporter permease [Helicobacter saguini]MWV66621.1 ABC transporter permease [Helicobacter saguini]MWV68971.1 ABC transporter permease [Helicobacter saguini]MWV71476.1 ABC transporter permease [Helicobacter saguini]TLD94137.1 hypothetical protein LS64_007375 [Helicobacter saguini]